MAPPKTPIWVHANDARKKLIMMPTLKYAGQVFLLLGGLTLASWLAPSTAGTILLLNVVLVNLMVAMFADTYSLIKKHSKMEASYRRCARAAIEP